MKTEIKEMTSVAIGTLANKYNVTKETILDEIAKGNAKIILEIKELISFALGKIWEEVNN